LSRTTHVIHANEIEMLFRITVSKSDLSILIFGDYNFPNKWTIQF